MLNRVASFAHTSAMTAASLKVQAKLADQQDQTASGLKSQTYGGIAKSTASILTLSNQSARLTADNTGAIASAYALTGTALSGIGTLQESIAIQASSLQSITDRNTAKIDAINGLVTDLKGADLTEAAIMTTQYQTQLEALFSMISTLSSLSLSKYL